MADSDDLSGLRAARTARGWSQAEAARELAALAGSRGAGVAAPASLKTLLSRWENGHAVPDPQYRSLLIDLYGRSAAALGLVAGGDGAAGDGLAAALAGAAAVRDAGLDLWWQQLALARDLDDELGAAGAGELVRVQVDHLADVLLHTIDQGTRSAVAAVLTGAAALAGAQSLDRARPDHAWRRYDQARTAAREAELSGAEAVAVAGQAAVLVDIGEAGTAIGLLAQARRMPYPAAQARLDAALAEAMAATGEQVSSREAMAAAERRLHGSASPGSSSPEAHHSRIDVVDRRQGPPVELADLHRWRGRVLVTLGDAGAVEPLHRALAAGPRSVRHRAAVHADLALTLQTDRPLEAAEHATTARGLATAIGSERITARLGRLGGGR